MLRVFTNGPRDQCSIPGRVISKTQKVVLDAYCLTLSIIRYGSRISGAIQGKEMRAPLHLGVVLLKLVPSGSPSTTVGQLTIYI